MLGKLNEFLAPLRLLDLARPLQQRIKITVLGNQLCGGLDADAGHAGHVVDRVASERLHVDDLVGCDAEFFEHLVGSHALIFHRIEHIDARPHQLHQVLVGRHDRDLAAGFRDLGRVGRDQVVGLESLFLDARDIERLHGIADQRELRD